MRWEKVWMDNEEIRLFLKECKLVGYYVVPPDHFRQGCLIKPTQFDNRYVCFFKETPERGSQWFAWHTLSSVSCVFFSVSEALDYVAEEIREWG